MAATLRAEVSVTLSTPMREGSGAASARAYHTALAYLRAFLVVLVVAHHSVITYIDGPTSFPKSLLTNPPWWRAFPVIDPRAHWAGFNLFTGFRDDFFMSLMFLVSGLFVWSSLRRNGNATFLRDRIKRLEFAGARHLRCT
jgi:peptidoglycan/LPS O-acetylase OafA/YrhL